MQKLNLSEQELSTGEVCKILQVSRGAISFAIKNRKLKANLKGSRWIIKQEDVEEYYKNKYSRSKSIFDGKPLYCVEQGEYSVNESAKFLDTNPQRIYFLIKQNRIPHFKKGSAIIIKKEELDKIYLAEKQHKEKRLQLLLKKAQ